MVKLCVSDKPDAGLKVYVAFLLKVNAHRKGKGPNQTSKYLAQEAPRRVPSEGPFRSSSSRLGYLMDYLYGTRRIAMALSRSVLKGAGARFSIPAAFLWFSRFILHIPQA